MMSWRYERLQIGELLGPEGDRIAAGVALCLIPDTDEARGVLDAALRPVLQDNGFIETVSSAAFDSDSTLAAVARNLRGAELIIADVTGANPDVMYVLGLCHGMGRCPLLIGREPMEAPFDLRMLRWVEYEPDGEGLHAFRQRLSRAVRVFLAARRARGDEPPSDA